MAAICIHHVTDGDDPCGHTEEAHGTDQEVDLDGRPTSPEYLVCFSCLEEERPYWSHDFDPDRIHFEVVKDDLTTADYAKGAMDGIATVIASDIDLRRQYAALQERLEAAEAALESIAGMVLDGEDDGEGAYEMSTEDAYESIAAAVQRARAALRGKD